MNIELLQETAIAIHNHRVFNNICGPAWKKLYNAEKYINKLITDMLSDAS